MKFLPKCIKIMFTIVVLFSQFMPYSLNKRHMEGKRMRGIEMKSILRICVQ